MQQLQGAALQRITSIALILGGILTVTANAIFPRADDPSSLASSLMSFAENDLLAQLGSLGIAIGVVALVVGFAGIYRSIDSGAAAAWTRVGFYALVLRGAVITLATGLILGAVEAAIAWGETPADPTLLSIAGGAFVSASSTFDLAIIVFWGALAVVAIGMAPTNAYPQWASWSLLLFAIATGVMGVVRLFADSSIALEFVFAVPAGLTSVWAIVIGFWVVRKVW